MTNKVEYVPESTDGDGIVVAFDFDFKVFDVDDLVVTLVDKTTNTGVVNTRVIDYTVALNTTSEGGTITMIVPPSATERLLRERALEYRQPQNIPDLGNIQESVLEGGYDRNSMQIQQLLEMLGRKIGISSIDSTNLASFDPDIKNFTSNAILKISAGGVSLSAVGLSTLGAFSLPTTSGMMSYVGGDTAIARELVTSGSAVMTNGTGVSGNPIFDVSPGDRNLLSAVATYAGTGLSQGASLMGLHSSSGVAATNVLSAIAELAAENSGVLGVVDITFTRTMDTTGVQTINHGFGATPLLLFAIMADDGNQGGNGFGMCAKEKDAANFGQIHMSRNSTGGSTSGGFQQSLLGFHETTSSFVTGTVTDIDDTEIEITWAQTGSSTNAVDYQIIAVRI